MPSFDEVLTAMAGTCLGMSGRELLSLYQGLDEATASFAAACSVACPEGCGRCCEGFDPPVTSTETDLVALHVLSASDHVPIGSTAYPCPFFMPSAPFHCGIYPVRPLVCRAFGFTAVGGRDGEPRFRFCRHMPGRPPSELDGRSMRRLFPQSPPRVDDYGVRLSAISHESMGGQPLLSAAVSGALDRVRALYAYVRAADGP
jgi:Fe-S-cluster containining protein